MSRTGMDNGKAAEYAATDPGLHHQAAVRAVRGNDRTKKFFVLCTQVIVGVGFAGVALAMSLPTTWW